MDTLAVLLGYQAFRSPRTDPLVGEALAVSRSGLRCLIVGLKAQGLPSAENIQELELLRLDHVAALKAAARALSRQRATRVWPWQTPRPTVRSTSDAERTVYRLLFDTLLGLVRWLVRVGRRGVLSRVAFAACAIRAIRRRFPGYRLAVHTHDSLTGVFLTACSKVVCLTYVADHHAFLRFLPPTAAPTSLEERLRAYWLRPGARPYIEDTIRVIPKDVRSVVDLGCGDGAVIDLLRHQGFATLGVDKSPEALARVLGPSLLADVVTLRLEGQWDLVLTNELLEHLDRRQLPAALRNMKELAGRYVVVTVPNRERLAAAACRCSRCGYVFHANLHRQRFTAGRLRGVLAPEYHSRVIRAVGAPKSPYHPLLLWLKQRVAGVWARGQLSHCPKCGSLQTISEIRERNSLSRWCDRLNAAWVARRRGPLPRTHLLALYERNSDYVTGGGPFPATKPPVFERDSLPPLEPREPGGQGQSGRRGQTTVPVESVIAPNPTG